MAVVEAALVVVVVAVDAVADAADVAEADNQINAFLEEISGGFAQTFELQSSFIFANRNSFYFCINRLLMTK
ncbi:hypothetical protein ABID52_001846 [Fictibacillus halophilus]|uniref:Secreted protein n=1 Tax=Fictibacillus halophilus TaxID=1610490 RepID=A0ABV2LI41_9BACL